MSAEQAVRPGFREIFEAGPARQRELEGRSVLEAVIAFSFVMWLLRVVNTRLSSLKAAVGMGTIGKNELAAEAHLSSNRSKPGIGLTRSMLMP